MMLKYRADLNACLCSPTHNLSSWRLILLRGMPHSLTLLEASVKQTISLRIVLLIAADLILILQNVIAPRDMKLQTKISSAV